MCLAFNINILIISIYGLQRPCIHDAYYCEFSVWFLGQIVNITFGVLKQCPERNINDWFAYIPCLAKHIYQQRRTNPHPGPAANKRIRKYQLTQDQVFSDPYNLHWQIQEGGVGSYGGKLSRKASLISKNWSDLAS